uniref:Gag-Pol polyprotein n=1 Tax=Tanacetum cinerariifolium TaxID=118510 RepID=A0A6L2LWX4_TANCI|nr:hypothetical protein [Tanacetum cinerariifolium]
MSNTNNTMQTQTSWKLVAKIVRQCLHRNPPYKYTCADKEVPVTEGSPETTTVRKFTSRDGESLKSYYSRFYKMMNKLVRNQCDVTNHQVNVQFLLQLQPEWQRFILVKQSQELKTVSYHKLYDILKQHHNEVNEIRAERLAHTANPLALVTLDVADNSGPIFDTEPLQQKTADQNDDDDDLANERELLASLIEKLKCEIDDSKNRNKILETSNKALVDKLKDQETISILSQQKEAQIKLYKTRKDKEIDKVIALENKVKVLDNIVYKIGQSVQTMNMLNSKCKTSFAKPEFLKKAQRANDYLALMLSPESDEVICLEKESRSK